MSVYNANTHIVECCLRYDRTSCAAKFHSSKCLDTVVARTPCPINSLLLSAIVEITRSALTLKASMISTAAAVDTLWRLKCKVEVSTDAWVHTSLLSGKQAD